MKIMPAFKVGWKKIVHVLTKGTDDYFSFRNWQEKCFEKLKDVPNWLINVIMGGGKSLMICALLVYKLKKDPNLRAIIAVPYTDIGSGFQNNKITFPDGFKFHWCPFHDLTEESNESNTNQLMNWFQNPRDNNNINDRVILCTRATLVKTFKQYSPLFKNLIVIIDEFHHTFYGKNDEIDIELTNGIGSIEQYALNNKDKNIQIGGTTATLGRGDGHTNFPKIYAKDFIKFDLPFDEILESYQYLRSFSYDFIVDKASYKQAVKHLFCKNKINKTIIYAPVVNSRFSVGDKHNDVQQIINAIAGYDNPEIRDLDKPIMRVKQKNKYVNGYRWVKVVNLVDEKLRTEKKRAIKNADKNDKDSIDVIITLNMLKEGSNWRWAEREIIIGTRNSLIDLIQMIGRLFRDVEGKPHVEVFQVFTFAFDQLNKEEFGDDLNDYLKAVFASFLLEDIIQPKILNIPGKGNPRGGNGSFRLIDIFEDEIQLAKFIEGVRDDILKAVSLDKTSQSNNFKLKEKLVEIVKDKLKKIDINEFHEEIANHIFAGWQKRTATLKGINISGINFDIIQDYFALDFLLFYTSKTANIKTFRELREKLSNRIVYLSFEEAREFTRKLGLNNREEWIEYCQSGNKPDNIPATPWQFYEGLGWINLGDWLGTGTVASFDKEFYEYDHVHKIMLYMRSTGKPINSMNEYNVLVKNNGNYGKVLEYREGITYPDDYITHINGIEIDWSKVPLIPQHVYKEKK